ncbi:MAG: GGDEF domain-containing protein [Spirochaetia bacterium]|nr:GGDEF domain-containing protein [Spirochaetia bacterium]
MKKTLRKIIERYDPLTDFRVLANFSIALVGVLFLTPFTINNFMQNRLWLGCGVLFIVIICFFIILSIIRGQFRPIISFIIFTPFVIVTINMIIVKLGLIGILWSYPSILAIYFMLTEKKAWIANLILLVTAIPLIFMNVEIFIAARAAATMICVSICSALFIRIILNQQALLKKRALIDPLTKLYNRNILHITLEQAIAQNRRTGTQVSLLCIDVDFFKKINDTKGHDAGDTVLRNIGSFLKKEIRLADKAFRMGGEEFIIMLYDTDNKNAKIFAEKLRKKIEKHSFLPDVSITVSIGVAALRKNEQCDQWMKRCDENLYKGKKQGRNRVVA